MTFSCMRHNRLKEISVYKSGKLSILRTAKSAKISRRKPCILLSLSASKNNTFRTSTSRKKLGSCSISFLVHPGRSPGILLCLSASRLYNTFRISTRSRKKKIGSCSISFVVHPGRSPGILLCLSASRIYNTFSISTRSRKKQLGSCSISFLVHPGRSLGMI